MPLRSCALLTGSLDHRTPPRGHYPVGDRSHRSSWIGNGTCPSWGSPVGAENSFTSRDLQILVYEAAEPISSQGPDGRLGVRGSAACGCVLIKRSVRPVGVVAAPRGAALYRSRSGQGREEMSRDLMADP
jgi:hypothetical protein